MGRQSGLPKVQSSTVIAFVVVTVYCCLLTQVHHLSVSIQQVGVLEGSLTVLALMQEYGWMGSPQVSPQCCDRPAPDTALWTLLIGQCRHLGAWVSPTAVAD